MKKPKTANESSREETKHKDAEFLEDHRALHVVLGRVEGTKDLQLLIPLLEEMHRLLQAHFKNEEASDGLYGTINEVAPQHQRQVETFVAEHGQFLKQIDGLEEKIKSCLNGPIAEIHNDIREFCEHLKKHEAAETTLFMDALYTDLGESS